MPIHVIPPPPPKKLTTCKRCGLQSPENVDTCTHCTDLSDRELHTYLQKHIDEQQAGTNLGRYFIIAALGVLLLMFWMFLQN